MDRNNNNNEKQEKKQPPNISQFRGTKYNKYEYNIQQNIIKNNKENIPPIEGETNKYLITDNLINKKDNTSSIKKNIYSFIKDDEKKDL